MLEVVQHLDPGQEQEQDLALEQGQERELERQRGPEQELALVLVQAHQLCRQYLLCHRDPEY